MDWEEFEHLSERKYFLLANVAKNMLIGAWLMANSNIRDIGITKPQVSSTMT